MVTFKNADGDRIHYKQHWRESGELRADTENVHHTEVTIRDCKGIVYSNKGVTYVVFSDKYYTYMLSGVISLEELVQVSESI